MTPLIEMVLVRSATAFLVAGAMVAILRERRIGTPLMGVAGPVASAVACLLAAVTGRWLRESQGPFLTLYDVLLSNLFTLSLIFLVALLIAPTFRRTAPAVTPFLALLGVWTMTVPAEAVPLPATFDNPWLWVHVLTGKIFLGLCMLATGAAALLLLGHPGSGSNRSSPSLDAIVWPTLSLAFLCHSFMLIAGAVWAYSAWGRYWAWDPLETWAFATWLAMAILLHARLTFRRLPPPLAWSGVATVFVLAFLTFFGVPFVSLAPHKGVM